MPNLTISSTPISNIPFSVQEVIVARSGYWGDIQDAIDAAVANGIKNVLIPEGTHNFVEVEESWSGARVTIPKGINVFGVKSNTEWRTILQLPWDVPGSASYKPPQWFRIEGDRDPENPVRFSGIKMVGYREFDHESTQILRGIAVEGIINFRIDNCYLRHIPEGIGVNKSCGVIDHCVLDNVYGWHGGTDWSSRTIGYGVACSKAQDEETEWPDIKTILGKYLDYSVYVEDCYFTKWRSCMNGNFGAHYVFRHNVIENGFAYGEIDAHPSWWEPYVACRAVEVYDNKFINPVEAGHAMHIWAGGGTFFNNYLRGYGLFMYAEGTSWSEEFDPKDLYIWDNDIGGANFIWGPVEEGVHYFLYKPDWYEPYPYPHWLTQVEPTGHTPSTITVATKKYLVEVPREFQV